ncbi:MAG: alpha/beta hydrolase [Candidatus Devosia phytovorans]|uniref:Alpha/beta hydrolase n=1 Tax=Candidatus Devosia phytovorans TaxID=3121372 RepID=A0AAJ5VV70_9HYPH|nr:alpha/beta hydrolase [Devosia sp.]WEK04157.1 MAG: alpha/beta hydrolase [Devosia sp.]
MSDSHEGYSAAPAPSGSIGRLAELFGGDPMSRLDADMKHVLDRLTELGARSLEHLTPEMARRQPQPSEAIAAILGQQSRERPDDGVETEDISVTGAEGELPARIYRPAGLLSRLNPVVLYFHGGGFVTGDLDSHDASARALARRTGAIVVSAHYRLAPEHRLPAAHEDAWAIWQWLIGKVEELNGDSKRLAVAGEDAGGNLAMHIALSARDAGNAQPVHQLLIHPIAGSDMATASYGEMLRARPIGLPAMRWRYRHLVENQDDLKDSHIDLATREDLAGVAPATLILAGLDPLRSEGAALAEALEAAHVPVSSWIYEGVTQGFFGLGLVVTKALFAQSDAADALSKAFAPARKS